MALSLMKMVRDTLVNDSAMRTLLSVTTTGSAPVSPSFLEKSGVYPQIIYSIIDAGSDPGMNSINGSVTFTVEVQATGGINPHQAYGEIVNRISGLFDDLSITGAGVSGTGGNVLLFLKSAGFAPDYDEARKTYTKMVSYNYKFIGG